MHVLVVDDNRKMADYAVKFLMLYGKHTADIALRADIALTRVMEHKYDAVLIEFRLPHKDVGLNLAKSLREEGFNGLIIGLVTMPHTFTVEKMIEMGFNACIPKPLLKKHMEILAMTPGSTNFKGDYFVHARQS